MVVWIYISAILHAILLSNWQIPHLRHCWSLLPTGVWVLELGKMAFSKMDPWWFPLSFFIQMNLLRKLYNICISERFGSFCPCYCTTKKSTTGGFWFLLSIIVAEGHSRPKKLAMFVDASPWGGSPVLTPTDDWTTWSGEWEIDNVRFQCVMEDGKGQQWHVWFRCCSGASQMIPSWSFVSLSCSYMFMHYCESDFVQTTHVFPFWFFVLAIVMKCDLAIRFWLWWHDTWN